MQVCEGSSACDCSASTAPTPPVPATLSCPCCTTSPALTLPAACRPLPRNCPARCHPSPPSATHVTHSVAGVGDAARCSHLPQAGGHRVQVERVGYARQHRVAEVRERVVCKQAARDQVQQRHSDTLEGDQGGVVAGLREGGGRDETQEVAVSGDDWGTMFMGGEAGRPRVACRSGREVG